MKWPEPHLPVGTEALGQSRSRCAPWSQAGISTTPIKSDTNPKTIFLLLEFFLFLKIFI